ncbi:putative inactive receptor kinase [Sesamum alatum]|uniref:Inactive receptor kinase n=1 Tax=Sesamum alatum TaxID=300844 RepID=A0AAE1YBG0_9LAMI|nr:putative inactive receptor kinase [Sesamum alatum]
MCMMMLRVQLMLIFKVMFLLLSMADAETVEVRDALVQFMDKLAPQRGENWGWNRSSDPCKGGWKGVTCYSDLVTIKKIVLDELNLTGTLDAASLCSTKALMVLSLKSNNVVGALPNEISKCSRLTHVYLHGNNFSGSLPGSLSTLSNLKRVDVSDNGFSGGIPDMSRISGLLTFLADNNQLSGEIPKFEFSNLEEFNVSNNNLSGPVPDFGGRFNETSVLGNPRLCGKPLSNACPPSPPAAKKGSSKKDYFMYSGYALIGLIIVSLVAFKLIKKGKTNTKKNTAKKGSQATDDKVSSTSSESKAVGGNRSEFSITSAESGRASSSLVVLSSPVVNELKFEDLLRAPAQLIGRGRNGSLYKVTLNEGVTLAVKRIREWYISRDDFKKRMQRIDQIKHPNVLPVIAFYCSSQEKLLVYEFQENGSLFRLLHGSPNGQSFDWGSRLVVAAKISEALAFMHEGLQADGIAHGNLKSSNVLLSNKMEPLISEYGLSDADNQDQSFLAQIDSFQENNSPPGGIISSNNAFKTDTYSFGIILLELLTGKVVQNNGFDLARWVNSAIREEWTVEVFDKALVSEGASEESMVSLLQVALKCIDISSAARPNMREVAGIINTIREHEEKSISSDP